MQFSISGIMTAVVNKPARKLSNLATTFSLTTASVVAYKKNNKRDIVLKFPLYIIPLLNIKQIIPLEKSPFKHE